MYNVYICLMYIFLSFQDVIKYFKDVPEPEFPGAVILEQYQANVNTTIFQYLIKDFTRKVSFSKASFI